MARTLSDQFFYAERLGREGATALQLDRGRGVYSRAPLRKLRKAFGLLRELEDEAFSLIDRFVDSDYKYEYEVSLAEELSPINVAESLFKQVSAEDYALSAKCDVAGGRCGPDVEDVAGELRRVDFYEVEPMVESLYDSGDEEDEEAAEWWFSTTEKVESLLDSVEKEASRKVEGPSYPAAYKAAYAASKLAETLDTMCFMFTRDDVVNKATRPACHLVSLANRVGAVANVAGKTRIFLNPEVELTERDVEEFRRAGELLGRPVGFFVPYAKPGDKLKASAVLNDLANYVHVVADEMVKRGVEAKGYRKVGRCSVKTGSDELLEELCLSWDTAVNIHGAEYISADAVALDGRVDGKTAQIRLGNANNHAAEIVKTDGEAVVKYYDYDYPVRFVVKRMLEGVAGCRCSDKPEADMLECACRLSSKEDAVRIGVALSRATTMDIRMESEARWGEEDVYDESFMKKYADEELDKALKTLNQVMAARVAA